MKKNLEEMQAEMRMRNSGSSEIVPEDGDIPLEKGLTKCEQKVLNVLKLMGYKDVIRNGWPDFGVLTDKGLIGIEVKRAHDKLRNTQVDTHKLLKKCGIKTIVIRGDDYMPVIQRELSKKISS